MRSLSNRGVKFATRPSAGIYYALPNKDFSYWEVVYRREDDEYSDPMSLTHFDLFQQVICRLKDEFKLSSTEVAAIGDNYTGLPRGRIASPKETGGDKWLILHGGDAPDVIKHQVLTAFGLLGLTSNKVEWKVVDHEMMNPQEKKLVLNFLKTKK